MGPDDASGPLLLIPGRPMPFQPCNPAVVAAARRLVEGSTASYGEIAAAVGASSSSIARWTRMNGWVRPRGPAQPLSDCPADGQARHARTRRATLIKRLWRAAERHVSEIEERLGAAERDPADRERDARIMATLVRTLRDLSALRRRRSGEPAGGRAGRKDDDARAQSYDDLYRAIEAQIDRLRREGRVDGDLDGADSPAG